MNVPCKWVHLLDRHPDRHPDCDPDRDPDTFVRVNLVFDVCISFSYSQATRFVLMLPATDRSGLSARWS